MSTHQNEVEMLKSRALSFVFLVIGAVLLFFAYQSSQSLNNQVTEVLTGHFTDATTGFLILGAASAAAGVGLMLFGKPGSK